VGKKGQDTPIKKAGKLQPIWREIKRVEKLAEGKHIGDKNGQSRDYKIGSQTIFNDQRG